MIIQEAQRFIIALSTLTRLPIYHLVPDNWYSIEQEELARSRRYYGVVGLMIGALNALVFLFAINSFDALIAAVLSIIFGLLLTGGFHEDGLADSFDGFYGGFDTERKLSIMKDSRIGTYGSLSLWGALSLKTAALASLAEFSAAQIVCTIVAAHGLSRILSLLLTKPLNYVQAEGQQKFTQLSIKPNRTDIQVLLLTLCVSLSFILVVFSTVSIVVYLLIILLVTGLLAAYWQIKHIAGFTGDSLGASQQVTELIIYLSLIALSKPEASQFFQRFSS